MDLMASVEPDFSKVIVSHAVQIDELIHLLKGSPRLAFLSPLVWLPRGTWIYCSAWVRRLG